MILLVNKNKLVPVIDREANVMMFLEDKVKIAGYIVFQRISL